MRRAHCFSAFGTAFLTRRKQGTNHCHVQEITTRALLREWLSDAGYRVREVGLGRVQREDAADLVIASVYMPKQEGAQLLRAVQAAHPGTPLIAISGAVSFRSLGRRSDALRKCSVSGSFLPSR